MDYFVKREERWSIEPEETLLDRHSAEQREYAQFETPIKPRNLVILVGIVALVGVVFAGRTAYLQTLEGNRYAALAEGNKTRAYPVLARRGVIYDRNRTPLVENVPSFDVVAIPADLPRVRDERARMIDALAEALGEDGAALQNIFAKMSLADVNPVLVKENVDRELALRFETQVDDFPGIELKKNALRHYLEGESMSQVLGYVGRVSVEDLRAGGFSPIDYVGKAGVEYSYDSRVRGENGVLEREVDAVSRITQEIQVSVESAGSNVVLTVDAGLQKKIAEVLANALKLSPASTGAAGAALNPKTGEVLALVSLPTYDNNIFSVAASRYAEESKKPGNPFFNRAISGLYPPGSSIKPFIGMAALEEGVVSPSTQVFSTGAVIIPNLYNPSAPAVFRDWKAGGHGLVNITQAIMESVNTFFFAVGGGYGDIQGLGVARIKEYLDKFGFGIKTGIDLPSEGVGRVPDRAWKEGSGRGRWTIGDTYNISIGQGDLLVTPLQLARGYAFLANGGRIVKPYIVQSVLDKDGRPIFENKPAAVEEDFISEKDLALMRGALRQTVVSGTARGVAGVPVAVAGKTGTAQSGPNTTHAWFSSFAPYDDPELVLVLLIENGGEGSEFAVPAAREVYAWYFGR